MSMVHSLQRCAVSLRIAALAALICTSVSAAAVTISFSGSGLVTGPAQVPPTFTDLHVDPATSSYTFGGIAGWTLDALFSFNLATLSGSGSGVFAHGGDSLKFNMSSTTPSLGAPLDLVYTITGGTGAFAGFIGSGSSQVQLLGNPLGLPDPIPFTESNGTLTVAIPEPSELALLVAGLGALLMRTTRRRGTGDPLPEANRPS